MSARGANSRWRQLKPWAGVGTLSGAGEEQTSWGSIPLIILPSMRNVDPQLPQQIGYSISIRANLSQSDGLSVEPKRPSL